MIDARPFIDGEIGHGILLGAPNIVHREVERRTAAGNGYPRAFPIHRGFLHGDSPAAGNIPEYVFIVRVAKIHLRCQRERTARIHDEFTRITAWSLLTGAADQNFITLDGRICRHGDRTGQKEISMITRRRRGVERTAVEQHVSEIHMPLKAGLDHSAVYLDRRRIVRSYAKRVARAKIEDRAGSDADPRGFRKTVGRRYFQCTGIDLRGSRICIAPDRVNVPSPSFTRSTAPVNGGTGTPTALSSVTVIVSPEQRGVSIADIQSTLNNFLADFFIYDTLNLDDRRNLTMETRKIFH